ncbi:MAG: protein NosL [bacterium]|nr:protein NosL [bacterium]
MTRLFSLLIALLCACSEPSTGPTPIRWDRDTCERCRMTISDPRFAAQIRLSDSGQVRDFDDLGCAVLWLDESEARYSEIWIRDHRTSVWLDARQAYYEPARGTPMDFGWGATSDPGEKHLSFEQVRARVRSEERSAHGSVRR